MANENVTATSIRVPDEFLEEIKDLAAKIGDSQNGMMLNLMFMGMKVYKDSLLINPEAHRS